MRRSGYLRSLGFLTRLYHLAYRALPTAESTAGLSRLRDLQGLSGLWFVGAYAWEGIPLLEGCVASAEEVVLGPGGILSREKQVSP